MAKMKSDPKTWDQHLTLCMMAYWRSEHISTGYTPFTLMFGREIRLPLDVMVGEPDATPDYYGDYVSRLKSQLSNASAQHRQKEYFDRGVKERLYQPGDQVFLFDNQLKPGEAAKFHRKWMGGLRSVGTYNRGQLPHQETTRPSNKSLQGCTF